MGLYRVAVVKVEGLNMEKLAGCFHFMYSLRKKAH
jgi:hypothetical protein